MKMNRKEKTYLTIIVTISVILFIMFWIKIDIYEEIYATFHSLNRGMISGVKVSPCLLPDRHIRIPAKFIKFRLVWKGPHLFRVSFRDFEKQYDKVRLISVSLSYKTGKWKKNLDIPLKYQGWRVIEPMNWTNEFKETWFFATEAGKSEDWGRGTINLPDIDSPIFVDLSFELEKSGDTTKHTDKFILVREPKKKYRSYIISKMVGA